MILVFAGAAPALAQDDDYARSGVYLGVNMTGTWYNEMPDDLEEFLDSVPPPQPFIRVHVEDPVGVGGRVGYRFHPHLAGEVEFRWSSNADVQFEDADVTLDIFEFETITLTGNAKGYLLTGRIQPFFLAGAGFMRVNQKEHVVSVGNRKEEAFAARFGAGIDFYFTPNIVGIVEGGYVLATGKLDGLDHVLWSIGLQYRF
jgi:opacity protein-like surface antigen